MSDTNGQWLLKRRPHGEPTLDDFEYVETPVPEPGPGKVLCRNLYLSLDPYMRGRMNAGASYAANVGLGEVMVGGTVGQVVQSNQSEYAVGDIVSGFGGWQTYFVSKQPNQLPKESQAPLSAYLGVLGMPGITAWWGLTKIGRPKQGETVVVSSAAGAVGSLVGQLAKLRGCRAVGVAGGEHKCHLVVNEFGFDACVDYKTGNVYRDLKAACPDGIDIYFENVGGEVQQAAFRLLNDFARIPVCGLISQYNATALPPGPNLMTVLVKRVLIQGFIIFDHYHSVDEFISEVAPLVAAGEIKYKEDIVEGLEKAPEALIGLLRGENVGKLIVKIADEVGA